MDVIKVLTADHDAVRDLFDEFRTASDSGDDQRMKSLQKDIFGELETHTSVEEDIFYPAVRDLDVDELEDLVNESVQEHHVVRVLMREIGELSDMDVFQAKMEVLMENVEHHAEEEEDEMFPKLREQMPSEERAALGQRLEAAKGS